MRRGKKTLHGFVTDVLNDMGDEKPDEIYRKNIFSSNSECVEEIIRFIQTNPGNEILLVGKSLGAVRTWWALNKYWTSFERRLKVGRDVKLGVALIDPHGWQYGDGHVGGYGTLAGPTYLEWEDKWDRPDVRIETLYQRNKYPKGVPLGKGSRSLMNVKLKKGATHWNVTQIDTWPGRKCANAIQNMIEWLRSDHD